LADYLKGCVRYHGGGSTLRQQGDDDANYANLRSQCYYLLAEMVNGRAVSIDPDLGQYRVDIAMELEHIRRKDDLAEGKLKVIPKIEIKESLGHSPDYADVFMMRMLFELRSHSVALDHHAKRGDKIIRKAQKDDRIRRWGLSPR
jgi:hypothetical protein